MLTCPKCGNLHVVGMACPPNRAVVVRQPWECPRCHAMNAPWVEHCQCGLQDRPLRYVPEPDFGLPPVRKPRKEVDRG